MDTESDVAIIGAGPYGLSMAAHLAARGVDFRIFGTPMQTWRTQMLRDAHLKSDGFATSLSEPSGRHTLRAHCSAAGLPYADAGVPVPLASFIAYGLAFQQQCVPQLEPHDIAALAPSARGFALRTATGETFTARRVVVATGIGRFQHVPRVLAGLPAEHVSHSSAHRTVERFAAADVVIVGGGASALDLAAALLTAGARVRLVARRAAVKFHHPPRPRGLRERLAAPMSGLGPGWKSRLCTDAPLLFHAMPEAFRTAVVRRHLGPAACWFTRDAVEGRVEYLLGRQIAAAAAGSGCVRLTLRDAAGGTEELSAAHVIAATGYRVDLTRLTFLSEALCRAIRLGDGSPALDRRFESSVPGLYFVGAAAANSFGPLCRFVFGTGFTAARLAAHLARGHAGRMPARRPAALRGSAAATT
jgi:thioredoxin reductase